jgi:hypothetical protein
LSEVHSFAMGGISKKRPLPYLHKVLTRSNKMSPRTSQTAVVDFSRSAVPPTHVSPPLPWRMLLTSTFVSVSCNDASSLPLVQCMHLILDGEFDNQLGWSTTHCCGKILASCKLGCVTQAQRGQNPI